MEKRFPIAFAFYKNDTLIGYRLDTVGTIKMAPPKIYYYSKEQVETVLHNIQHNVLNKKGFGEALGITSLAKLEEDMHQLLQDSRAFEVRVVKCPGFPTEKVLDPDKQEMVDQIIWDYPIEDIEQWMTDPNKHEVVETHYFSLTGLITTN